MITIPADIDGKEHHNKSILPEFYNESGLQNGLLHYVNRTAVYSLGKFITGLVAFFFILLLFCSNRTDTKLVRVGVYSNPPKVEIKEGSTPCGIFIDLIEEIARRENWAVIYVESSWDSLLSALETGRIDLMVDIAISEERKEKFDFNRLAVLSSWLQIYSRKGETLQSVSDLEGKRVAILKGSIQQTVIYEYSEKIGFDFEELILSDYESTLRHVKSGAADAVIVSRFFGYSRAERDYLVPTPVILHPTSLHFASPRGKNQELLEAIDKHLADLMNNPGSVYYRSLAKWLHESPRTFIPGTVLWLIGSITLFLLIFLVLTFVFKWQVRKRTEQLAEKNEELLDALRELKVARDEAMKRERLHSFGQLSSGLAHDFNNLLTPIMSYTDIMLNGPGELDNITTVRHNLNIISKAACRGAEIVHRMQKFHSQTRHFEKRETLNVNTIIDEVIELAKTRWKSSTCTEKELVEIHIKQDEKVEIMGKRSDIHEMMLNLILNSADAMPRGGRLEILTSNAEQQVTVKIRDTGAGMSEEVCANCLKPFFSTKGDKGTGIGLTMVNNIVMEHAGRLEIESKQGEGTLVIITFPAFSC